MDERLNPKDKVLLMRDEGEGNKLKVVKRSQVSKPKKRGRKSKSQASKPKELPFMDWREEMAHNAAQQREYLMNTCNIIFYYYDKKTRIIGITKTKAYLLIIYLFDTI